LKVWASKIIHYLEISY